MSINFQCKACDADFELEFSEIIESPDSIKCENCGSAPPGHRNHQFSTALEDFLTAVVAIRNKVTFELEIDSDNLPEPYGSVETGDDEGGLDGGLEFGERDESGRDGDDEEDEEDEMDGMSEVDEDDEEEEMKQDSLGFDTFGDDDDFDDDDDDFDDDFGELDDFDGLDDFDELDDDDDF